MAIANYTDLQAAIVDVVQRDDLQYTIVDAIRMVEADCNSSLRHPSMEETATLVLASNSSALPTDYLEAIRVYADVNTRTELEYVTPDWLDVNYPTGATTGAPYYTVLDGSLVNYLSGAANVYLTYYESIPALASSSTNWLLTRAPSVYLFGALMYISPSLEDAAWLGRYSTMYEAEKSKLQSQGKLHRYARANYRNRGPTP